jgi:methylated-DNA-[protein]-cysteine S-methyltransferase
MMTTTSTRTHTTIDSPIGELTLVAADGRLCGIYFPGHWTRPDRSGFGTRDGASFAETEHQLRAYFAGARTTFDLPLGDAEGDAFQRRVWELIDRIPYGRTATYGALARQLGEPGMAREVGAAVGANPLAIVRPCHRVVGKDGRLVGYAGGLQRKQFLLSLETGRADRPSDRLV